MKMMLHKLLAVLILTTPAAVQAQLGYITNAEGTGITIVGYSGPDGVTIPSAINGLPVTAIGDDAFYDNGGLIDVLIPNSVTMIGSNAFYYCIFLTNVTISDGITNLPYGVFQGCSALADITIPDSVTSIGDYAFQACDGLTSVTIPVNVSVIADNAFAHCSQLTGISVAAQNAIYSSTNGVLFDKNKITLVEYPGGGVGSFPIPNSVRMIGDYAFQWCSGLTNVTIPGSVASIGEYAFFACGLTSVTIPTSVVGIRDYTFYGTPLTSVTIPGNVADIGVSAFGYCTSLTNVTLSIGVGSVESNAFDGCSSLASVTIAGSVTNLGEYVFGDCDDLTQVFFLGNAPAADGTVFLVTGSDRGLPTWGYVSTAYYLADTTGWADFAANTGIPAVLWNPSIQTGRANFGLQSNQFGFDITGTTNIPIVVEACTNLAQPVWVPLQSMTLTNGSVHFSEPFQTNTPARFYRIAAP